MSDLVYEPVYQGRVRGFFEGAASRANRQIALLLRKERRIDGVLHEPIIV